MQQFSLNRKLGIASLSSHSQHQQLKVHTLLQDVKQKKPSINAFLGARYSRSADSVVDIAREIMNQGTDASKRLETIFYGYGHKSVGDMADLFLCLENVPMITAMRLFNHNPVLAGQERSTRFQNFQNPAFIKLPSKIKDKKIIAAYETIIHEHLRNYRELLKPTYEALKTHFKIDDQDKSQVSALQARTFDTVRYFLPMGLQTSLGFIMSARLWAELISNLRASKLSIENDLAELIYDLLSKNKINNQHYIPEADGLIRHTEKNQARLNSTTEILQLLTKYFKNSPSQKIKRAAEQNCQITYNKDTIHSLLRHYQLLLFPSSKDKKIALKNYTLKKLGQIIFAHHDQHHQLGNLAQSGSFAIEGWADFGILKDLNRHRSLERFVPIWTDYLDLNQELARENKDLFFLCNYLAIPELKKLKQQYEHRLIATYAKIKQFYLDSKDVLGENLRREYTLYLLPHAHATKYRFYGSFDDLQYTIHLRSRNGGHIAYRSLTYTWAQKLAELNPIWQALLDKLPAVKADSRKQFIDRS